MIGSRLTQLEPLFSLFLASMSVSFSYEAMTIEAIDRHEVVSCSVPITALKTNESLDHTTYILILWVVDFIHVASKSSDLLV